MAGKEVRAGKAFVEIVLRDRLAAGLNRAAAQLRGFATMTSAIGATDRNSHSIQYDELELTRDPEGVVRSAGPSDVNEDPSGREDATRCVRFQDLPDRAQVCPVHVHMPANPETCQIIEAQKRASERGIAQRLAIGQPPTGAVS